MFSKKIAGVILVQSFLVASLWASTDKTCVKNANSTYKTDIAACKELKGAEKKSCKKTAKEKKTEAKAACKAAPAK